jgi:prepilin-type N-terminal cleavage/methylation domain-containing protein
MIKKKNAIFNKNSFNKKQRGFTLLEMSIVLIIMSLLASAVFTLLPVQQNTSQYNTNSTQLSVIQAAINVYVARNNALPCPALTNSAVSSATFGISTDCTATAPAGTTDITIPNATTFGIRFGVVPTRTLNLSDMYMFDGWNHRIKYVVIKQMAVPTTQTINFNNFATNFPNSTATDTIKIVDANNNRINTANSAASNSYVAYVLVAHGPSGAGATRYDGASVAVCPSTGLNKTNCSGTNTFVDTFYNVSNATFYYDGTIRWKTYAQQIADSGLSSSAASTTSSVSSVTYALFSYTTTSASLASGTTAATWYTRAINTKDSDSTLTGATLSNNTIQLPAGNYVIRAIAAAYQIGKSKIRIYNVTGNSVMAYSTSTVSANSGYKWNNGNNWAWWWNDDANQSWTGGNNPHAVNTEFPEASVIVNLTGTTVVRIDQIFDSPNTVNGFGYNYSPDGSASDFLQIQIWQIG